jgi:hypothetical protein
MDSMREWGAILAEIGLCYLVRRCRDFGSSCEKGYFAVYGETEPKIIARGWRWWAFDWLGALVAWLVFALIFIYRSIAIYRWNMTYHDIRICEYVGSLVMFFTWNDMC